MSVSEARARILDEHAEDVNNGGGPLIDNKDPNTWQKYAEFWRAKAEEIWRDAYTVIRTMDER